MALPQSQKNLLIQHDSVTFDRFQEVFDQLMRRTWVVDDEPYNLSDNGWSWDFHNKKRALGTCSFNIITGRKDIKISRPLLMANIDTMAKAFEDTIRHEIAHAIDYSRRFTSDHSYIWQNIAVQVGADPKAGKKLNKSADPKWIGTCNACGGSVTRHKLTKNARASACSRCCNTHSGGFWDSEYVYTWEQQF